MKNYSVTFLLSLCILLLSGCIDGYARPHRDAVSQRSSKASDGVEVIGLDQSENSTAFSKNISASDRDNVFIIEITELREKKDENEPILSKRSREGSNFFSTIFCVLTRGYFSSYLRDILSFSKHFSDIPSSRRHLVFNVFLI